MLKIIIIIKLHCTLINNKIINLLPNNINIIFIYPLYKIFNIFLFYEINNNIILNYKMNKYNLFIS